MTRLDAWALVLLGLVVGVLSAGWIGEHRLLLAEQRASATWAQRVGFHTAVMDEALRLALPNPVERGLAWAHAVRAVSLTSGPAPEVRDDGPTTKRGKK